LSKENRKNKLNLDKTERKFGFFLIFTEHLFIFRTNVRPGVPTWSVSARNFNIPIFSKIFRRDAGGRFPTGFFPKLTAFDRGADTRVCAVLPLPLLIWLFFNTSSSICHHSENPVTPQTHMLPSPML
jgi:hypothetical protein